jgi:ribosomal protein S18 acetylase RimI-like enzyme
MAPIYHRCRPVTPEFPGFGDLAQEARAEGYRFLDRLAQEWADGSNRFDQADECLLGLFEGGVLVAVGGLNRDPYASDPGTGRIRHLYVSPNRRRAGLATRLMQELLLRGRLAFERLRLRTENPAAGRLYEALGFSPTDEPDATHIWSGSARSGQ